MEAARQTQTAKSKHPAFSQVISSPLGPLRLFSDGVALTRIAIGAPITIPDGESASSCPPGSHPDVLTEAAHQLQAYFDGKLQTFELPLLSEGTPFQRLVWKKLCEIPYGVVISYEELALRIGNPKAVRAVGGANGRNPIPIIIPCHRVIAKGGGLGGYSGGLGVKERLLALEGVAGFPNA